MSTPLSFYPRPPIDTGLGMHDSHLTGDNPPDIRQHARNLRRAGVTWYLRKMFPSFTTNDAANIAASCTEHIGKLGVRVFACTVQLPNGLDIGIGKM